MDSQGGSLKAGHLCVLVHGLWGNPEHMRNIAKCLRDEYSRDQLYLLLAKRNTGSFTYDGIERGGERVCAEIEEELRSIEAAGGRITKLSIIGYSLGGLVSRYTVGLLYAKGILDRMECMNFCTFASPHLGVRTPLRGWHNHIWNVVGARTLSMSGQQLFTTDRFRDTNRPLLQVMADPKSIFMSGLRKFKRHTLYANITNDKSAVYYTTCIQKTDPYRNLDLIHPNFVPGRGDIILDPETPFLPRPKLVSTTSPWSTLLGYAKRIPLALAIAVFVPIGVAAYLVNSVIQNVRSSQRIRLHERGQLGISIEEYRVPLLIKELRGEVESAYEALNNSQQQEYLKDDDDDDDDDDEEGEEGAMNTEDRQMLTRERRLSQPTQPTLALAPCQFDMVRNLDTLGWRKYPVWIHDTGHSHGAIIARIDKRKYDEGFIVLGHYAEEEFLL
ncbi:putative lipase [Beauveria bassiana]|uniref:Putative lipase n=1 Tax=Beauveria bassiana TaxID=176275 RepID=A0A2N6NXZ5_BEABA|nr:putative lipase [Beauveria bassiana]